MRPAVTAPVLTWLFPPGADVAGAIDADVEVTVGSPWTLDAVVAAARERGRAARVQVKVDTGLGRGGILTDWSEMVHEIARAEAEGAVQVTGVWSHLAWADAPQHPTVRAQQERFVEACDELERAGVRPPMRHLANSAATLTNPTAHFDLVRPGLAVYGLSPVPDLGAPADFGLREAMRVTARLSLVKRARAGQGVSYGHEHVTDRDTVLGLVPMGYADGIPRAAGGRGPVLVGGERSTIAGRVCMDQFVLDLGPGYAGAAGDEVVILGRGADGEPTAQEWAEASGTINYEIVTRMAPRLPRVLVGGDRADAAASSLGRWARRRVPWGSVSASPVVGSVRSTRRTGGAHVPTESLVVSTEDGVALHVEIDAPETASRARPHLGGRPPTVVLVHGFALSMQSWVLQRRALIHHGFRVVTYDQRGHGRSGQPDLDRCNVAQLGRDLSAVLDATCPTWSGRARGPLDGRDEHHVVRRPASRRGAGPRARRGPRLDELRWCGDDGDGAGSGGGQARRLRRARRAHPAVPPSGPIGMLRKVGRGVQNAVVERWAFDSPVSDDLVDLVATMIFETPFDVMAAFLPDIHALDVNNDLAPLTGVETLVMNGAGDLLTPPSHSEEIVRRIPGAEHVVVQDAGHILMLEHPQLVTQQLLMLISRAQRAVTEGVPVSSKPRVRRTIQDISKKRRVARARAATRPGGARPRERARSGLGERASPLRPASGGGHPRRSDACWAGCCTPGTSSSSPAASERARPP